MATAKELRAKLVIDAETEGEKSVEALVVDVEKLAAAGGDAAPRLQLLAAELRGLAQQQGLVDQFARLKAQTAAYAAEAEKAQASTKAAALALKEKQQALVQAQAAEQAAAASLADVRQQHEQLGQAVAAATAELKELGAASKEAGADTALQADRMKDVRAQLGVLQAEYRETGAQVKVLAAQQRESATAMRQVGAEVKGATQAFDVQRTAAQKANQAYAQGREELQRTRDAMSAVGVSSANLAAAQVRIRREMELVRDRVAQVGTAHTEMAAKAQAATASTVRSHRELSDKVHSISKELALLRSAYIGLQGVMSGGHALKGLADTADEVNNLQARVKLATGDGELFNQMWERVTQTALRTHSALEGTGTLFARIAATGKDAGLSAEKAAEQSLAVVETINQAVQLSGGSAESANAAITQLIQGLQSGVVRGEEFNSIMEQAPRLAQALADALGVTKGQLRAMAEEGRLTSEVVINALKSQAKAVKDEFATLPATIGRSVQDLSTAWSIFINETDKANGVSARVAGAIDLVANNLGTLMEVAAKAGQVMVAVFAARTLQAAQRYGLELLKAAEGTNTFTVAQGRSAGAIHAVNVAMQRYASIARTVGYAAIANEVLSIVSNYARYREELQKHIAMNAEVQKKQEQVVQRLKAISDSTGVVVTSMAEFDSALARGLIVQDEATGKWLSAAQAQEQLGKATSKTAEELASLKATEIVKQFQELAEKGKDVEESFKEISKALDFNKPENINGLIRALNALSSAGRLSADETKKAWQTALAAMNPQQLESTLARARLAYAEASIGAEQLAQINELVLAASFDRLGVNAAQALGKISTGAQEAIDSVALVARSAVEAGASVQDAARALEMAFAAAIPKADSLEAIDALQKQLKAMGEAGKISAEGIERTQAALDKQRATIEGQIPGIQSLEEALRNLGVKPQKELDALATSAKQAFDAVKASGTATPREISEAWKAMAEASIEANNGVADASLKAQAQQHGMVIETDKAGKSIVKSMKEAEDATKDVGKAAKATAENIAELSAAGWDATKDLVTQAREHNAALAKVETSWLDSTAAASKYAQEMAAVVWSANKSIEAMTQEHARLVEQMEAMADQQKQLEDQGNGAARGVEDLRLRLLELSGTEEEIARARHERDEAEVQRKMALMQIDLQRAQINGKDEEAARLQAELGLLQEQLKLLDQIFSKEEQQRKARERGERSGAGGGGSGGGSGSAGGRTDGGGLSAPPPAAPSAASMPPIVLNAYGINDPVKLADMLEPELKKRARLAR
jgi:tape measure domain-containing protein